MTGEETAALLTTAAARNERADEYEAIAVEMAMTGDVAQAAVYFTVANGLRGRARFLP